MTERAVLVSLDNVRFQIIWRLIEQNLIYQSARLVDFVWRTNEEIGPENNSSATSFNAVIVR